MLKQLSIRQLKAKDLIKFGESVELVADGELVGILIHPNTDFILDQSRALAETSNTVLPDPNRFEEAANGEKAIQSENRDTTDTPG